MSTTLIEKAQKDKAISSFEAAEEEYYDAPPVGTKYQEALYQADGDYEEACIQLQLGLITAAEFQQEADRIRENRRRAKEELKSKYKIL